VRPRLLASVDAACEHGARHQRDKIEGQAQLFGGFDQPDAGRNGAGGSTLPNAAAWSDAEQLAFEKETLGLYFSGHPITRFAADLKTFGARNTAELAEAPVSAERGNGWTASGPKPIEPDTTVGGIIAACRQLKTRKGDRMAVFTLEDALGGVEVIAFPEAYQRANGLIDVGTMVLVRGKLERDDETARIVAVEITRLETIRERLATEVAIRVKMPASRGVFEALDAVFARHRGDRRISFEIELRSSDRNGSAEPRTLRVKADVSAQIRVKPSASLISEVEQIVGEGSVQLR